MKITEQLYPERPQMIFANDESIAEVDALLRKNKRIQLPTKLHEAIVKTKVSLREHASTLWTSDAAMTCLKLAIAAAKKQGEIAYDEGLLGEFLHWARQNETTGVAFYQKVLDAPSRVPQSIQPHFREAVVRLILRAHGIGSGARIPRSTREFYAHWSTHRLTKLILTRFCEELARAELQLIAVNNPVLANSGRLSITRWTCPDEISNSVTGFEASVAQAIYRKHALTLAPLSQLDWQILPPDACDTVSQILSLGDRAAKKRSGSDETKLPVSRRPYIEALEQLAPLRRWQGVALTNNRDVYVAYEYEHLVAAEAVAGGHNALYVARKQTGDTELGEAYVPGAEAPTWHRILKCSKQEALEQGAKRHYHIGTTEEWQARVRLILLGEWN